MDRVQVSLVILYMAIEVKCTVMMIVAGSTESDLECRCTLLFTDECTVSCHVLMGQNSAQ